MGKTQKPFVDFIASEASIRSSSTRFMTFQRLRSNEHDSVSLSKEELIPREKLLKFATNIPRRNGRHLLRPTYASHVFSLQQIQNKVIHRAPCEKSQLFLFYDWKIKK